MGYKEIYNEWLTNAYLMQIQKQNWSVSHQMRTRSKSVLYRFRVWYSRTSGNYRSRNEPYEYLYSEKGNTGTGKLYFKEWKRRKGVAIAFDSRRMSPEFAQEAACCLAANGIKAYVFDSLRPTPELSYAVRKLGCIAGINITASHNPPEYNGYKVYWEDGAQITPPHDKGIMDEVKAVTDYTTMKTMPAEDAKAAGLYEVIGAEVDDAYIAELKSR